MRGLARGRCSDHLEAPTGWYVFGYHSGTKTQVVFSTDLCECGYPLWERPAQPGEQGGESKQVQYYHYAGIGRHTWRKL